MRSLSPLPKKNKIYVGPLISLRFYSHISFPSLGSPFPLSLEEEIIPRSGYILNMMGRVFSRFFSKAPRPTPSLPSDPQGNESPKSEEVKEEERKWEESPQENKESEPSSPPVSKYTYEEFIDHSKEGEMQVVTFSGNKGGRDLMQEEDIDMSHPNIIQKEGGHTLLRGHLTSNPMNNTFPLPKDPNNPAQGQNLMLQPGNKESPDSRTIQEAVGNDQIKIKGKVHEDLTKHANSWENKKRFNELLARKKEQDLLQEEEGFKLKKREKFKLDEDDE